MTIVAIPKAETELSDLVARVEAGEEIILARDELPVARMVLIERPALISRVAGRLAHLRDKIPANLFLEPMSEDELDAWEGKYSFPGDNGL